jgi:threonine dehydratase
VAQQTRWRTASVEQLAASDLRLQQVNHALRALSAKKMGTRAVIVMPITTPQVKIDAVRG